MYKNSIKNREKHTTNNSFNLKSTQKIHREKTNNGILIASVQE